MILYCIHKWSLYGTGYVDEMRVCSRCKEIWKDPDVEPKVALGTIE